MVGGRERSTVGAVAEERQSGQAHGAGVHRLSVHLRLDLLHPLCAAVLGLAPFGCRLETRGTHFSDVLLPSAVVELLLRSVSGACTERRN